MEYTLYCDESVSKDKKYGDFFGCCMIEAHNLQPVIQALETCKTNNGFKGEIKWTKVTDQYLEKYVNVMRLFFSFVAENKIKVRIMFRKTENQYSAISISNSEKYFKLYYQFIKHAFGFAYTYDMSPFNLRIYLDQLPAKREDCDEFKTFLAALPRTSILRNCALRIRKEQIAEIRSDEHVLLQCVDIVMGAMQFRLNQHHKDKPEGQCRRGKKTVAKENLYKVIYSEICKIYPHFNIGISTGTGGNLKMHWEGAYRHWLFVPYMKQKNI